LRECPGVGGWLAFLLGFGLVLTAAEGPLLALVGSEAALHDRVTAVRRERNLLPLRGSEALARVARAHAEEMAREGYLSHINPAGMNPLDRVRAAGVEGFRLLAENIGASSVTGDRARAVVEHWLESPSHRENLLNPAFNTTGIAAVDTADGRTIFVELFATFEDSARTARDFVRASEPDPRLRLGSTPTACAGYRRALPASHL